MIRRLKNAAFAALMMAVAIAIGMGLMYAVIIGGSFLYNTFGGYPTIAILLVTISAIAGFAADET